MKHSNKFYAVLSLGILLFFSSCASLKETSRFYSNTVEIKSSGASKTPIDKAVPIRVLILKTTNTFVLTGEKGFVFSEPSIFSAAEYLIKIENEKLSINDNIITAECITFSPVSNVFALGKKKYRGSLTVCLENGNILAINNVELEKYLYGVLPAEVSPNWDMEALKAQAVAARSFAVRQKLKTKDSHYDLDSTVKSQVYNGLNIEHSNTNKAVDTTAGLVLSYNGEVVEAFFHANSGGRTADSAEVWGNDLPYLRSVDDPYCYSGAHYKWTFEIDREAFTTLLKDKGTISGDLQSISVYDRTNSGRVKTLMCRDTNGETAIKATSLRNFLGVDKIRSTNFTVEARGDTFHFEGLGWGHGVGLSQEGAQ